MNTNKNNKNSHEIGSLGLLANFADSYHSDNSNDPSSSFGASIDYDSYGTKSATPITSFSVDPATILAPRTSRAGASVSASASSSLAAGANACTTGARKGKKATGEASDKQSNQMFGDSEDELISDQELIAKLNEQARSDGFTIIQVAINRAVYSSYDYKLKGCVGEEIIGSRVLVHFGGFSDKTKEIGIVVGIGAQAPLSYKIFKEAQLLDDSPIINDDIMQTLRFASAYYHYPLGQTLPIALPKLLREGDKARYKEVPGVASTISDELHLTLALKKMRSEAQRELLKLLQLGPFKRTELKEQGFNSAQINALIKKGLAKSVDCAKDIPPYDLLAHAQKNDLIANNPFTLNSEQQHVLESINTHQGYGVFLLNGVTGSGKTEVYLQAIEHTLKQGKRALVLVPEIALTPQTFRRFYQRFKVPIATLHSRLSDRERLDAFLDMATNRAAILIGTRSAIFTPINDLGLIVIDEEHDSSFKQSDTLRYHARTLAVKRAQLNNCKLILGSATPSLESIHCCNLNFFKRLDLLKRAQKAKLPRMHLIDLRKDELKDNVLAGIGEVVEKAVGISTAKHQQALLFLNRRGFSHAMICPHCGYVLMCPKCDVALTVHKEQHQLKCHVCDAKFQLVDYCPYCFHANQHKYPLIEIGVGTEQVAQYLSERFMDVGIERIDRDVITSREELDNSLKRVLNHDSEILVGTQMLAKGHDFPDVTVVGILDVDGGLYCDDFRGFEYTAQLITQVAGRAGRADKEGDVYIQTRHPEHILLQTLVDPNFNYIKLADQLLAIRKDKQQPPYSYQACVMVNSTNRNLAFYTLRDIMANFENRADNILFGVRPTIILSDRTEKRFNRYHFHCTINANTKESLDRVLDEITTIYSKLKNLKDLRFAIDVDPMTAY